MIFENLIEIAINIALEELEENKMIKMDFVRVDENECTVCFDKFFTNNLKQLSCNTHFSCNECWDNYVKSRINMNKESNMCFICYKRENLLNIEYNNDFLIEEDDEVLLDENIMNRIIPYNLLADYKYIINNINYHNLSVSIYQADFMYLQMNNNDVLINLMNNRYMFHKYGLAATIYKKAKYGLAYECSEWIKNNGIVPKNSTVLTNGGDINARIIHCNSPNPAGKTNIQLKYFLDLCYINVFEKILTMDNVKRIFLPGIFARRVNDHDDMAIKISVRCLFDILSIYIYDFKEKGINEINIVDYGKNPKILGYLSGYMDETIFI